MDHSLLAPIQLSEPGGVLLSQAAEVAIGIGDDVRSEQVVVDRSCHTYLLPTVAIAVTTRTSVPSGGTEGPDASSVPGSGVDLAIRSGEHACVVGGEEHRGPGVVGQAGSPALGRRRE